MASRHNYGMIICELLLNEVCGMAHDPNYNQKYQDTHYHVCRVKVKIPVWLKVLDACAKVGVTPSTVVHEAFAALVKRAGIDESSSLEDDGDSG
jgi:hypothetical protein